MRLHPSARVGFAAAATEYERGRPDYPVAAVEWLSAQLALGPEKTVLDLGAGTGKLTRALGSSGARIIALEPISEMATVIKHAAPQARVVTATAEHTGIASSSVDAATAGQAFHWFANSEALREIHRVLRPRGGLGLIWNRRDPRDPLWAEIDHLVEPLRLTEPAYRDHAWRPVLENSGLFSTLVAETFIHRPSVTLDQLVDRVLSISYVACRPKTDRELIAEQVAKLGQSYSGFEDGRVILPYSTEAWVAFAID